MIDLTRHPRLLRLLSLADRAWTFVRRRKPGWREADRNLAAFYERVWREAAATLGAEIEDLGDGAFEIRLGDAWTRVAQNATAIDDLASHRVVRMKAVMYRLLQRAGVPVPRHVAFDVQDMRPAVAFMESLGRECVVKPASGTGGGEGVATGIRTRWQLARAAYAGGRFGGDLLIEEQLEGENYRLLFLDGRLLDAVLRRPPTVMGDGASTVGKLVQQANAQRMERGPEISHGLLRVDIDMQRTLARQGLSLSSVLAKGAVVTLKTAINENRGDDNETVTEQLSAALIEDAGRAASVSGLRLAGVDVLTRDATKPLAETGGVILEVNSPPGYYWHYHKRDGVCPVALHVLEALLLGDGDKNPLQSHLVRVQ
jgi:cyanophycin synthetase